MKNRLNIKSLLLVLTLLLMTFPLILTFNDFLTQLVAKFNLYRSIESKIVPIEVKAGAIGSLRSLKLFLNEKKIPLGVRISALPFSSDPAVSGSAICAGLNRRSNRADQALLTSQKNGSGPLTTPLILLRQA